MLFYIRLDVTIWFWITAFKKKFRGKTMAPCAKLAYVWKLNILALHLKLKKTGK